MALVSLPSASCQRGLFVRQIKKSHLGSSSSSNSRFPRYQKIQNTRLMKIKMGPVKTKKSQKLKGAKIPTKKRMRPAASRNMAMKKNSRHRPR